MLVTKNLQRIVCTKVMIALQTILYGTRLTSRYFIEKILKLHAEDVSFVNVD